MLFSGSGLTHGQYYYQPAPDYYRNDTAEGTVFGGALGAITGALIGGKKKRGEGALIGAGVGALSGNLIGRSKDEADAQRAAAGATAVAHANQRAAVRAVTNLDLIRMTQAGVSDDLVISTLRTRGARLDLSPEALIALKESGVSERVLIAAQGMTQAHIAAPVPTTIVTESPPPQVIVAPPPRRIYYYHPYRHYRHPRARYHVGFSFR
jgi:hypothetical protein